MSRKCGNSVLSFRVLGFKLGVEIWEIPPSVFWVLATKFLATETLNRLILTDLGLGLNQLKSVYSASSAAKKD
jgi:hypothetical protein